MAIFVDGAGSIKLFRGDTGNIRVIGLPEGSEYMINFAITDVESGEILLEKSVENEGAESVLFSLTAEETELMTVEPGEKYKVYYYGVKLNKADGQEDTLIPRVTFDASGNPVFSKPAKLYCYPKYVEGLMKEESDEGSEEENE